jgi:cysteine desulfuration protein SufE
VWKKQQPCLAKFRNFYKHDKDTLLNVITIKEKQQEVIEEFAFFDDWMDKYNHLIALGKDLPLIDAAHKTDDNIIKGCQSRVWLHATLKDDRVWFTADSDAIITKGIIALMIHVFSGQKPQDIVDAETKFIDEIGLKDHLSPTRANGLLAMVRQMKYFAIAFSTKSSAV